MLGKIGTLPEGLDDPETLLADTGAGSKMKCNTVVMLSVEALYGQRIQAVSG
jgi:hypothetical protein